MIENEIKLKQIELRIEEDKNIRYENDLKISKKREEIKLRQEITKKKNDDIKRERKAIIDKYLEDHKKQLLSIRQQLNNEQNNQLSKDASLKQANKELKILKIEEKINITTINKHLQDLALEKKQIQKQELMRMKEQIYKENKLKLSHSR